MEFLIIYFIFSLTTSIAGYINLVRPVLLKIKEEAPLCDISQSPTIALFIFLVLGILIAPLMFLPSIIPSMASTFKDALFNTLME